MIALDRRLPFANEAPQVQSMWRGTMTFGDGWAVYAGDTAHQTSHAHAALQIAIAEAGSLTISLEGGASIRGEGLLVAPLVRHRLLVAEKPVVLIYLDAQTSLAQKLVSSLSPPTIGLVPEPLRSALGRDGKRMPVLLESLVHSEVGGLTPDPRLTRVLASLATDRSLGAVERAARAVGLSPARLRALAQSQLHLPLSKWLLWRKLAIASRAIAEGQGLAQAAISGGFADQAHLSRIMRRMFGVTPREASGPLRKQFGSSGFGALIEGDRS